MLSGKKKKKIQRAELQVTVATLLLNVFFFSTKEKREWKHLFRNNPSGKFANHGGVEELGWGVYSSFCQWMKTNKE